MEALACLINGVPGDVITVADRGLQYGDGLFETIAVRNGAPCLWRRHMERLQRGCRVLGLPLPLTGRLLDEALSLTRDHADAVLKIILTRGSGGRGYAPLADVSPTRILSLHSSPDYPSAWCDRGIAVTLCRTRVSENPGLAGLKHLNRLDQVLARQELSNGGYAEGLLRDTHDRLIGGTMTNLFLWSDKVLSTPMLDRCGIAGTVRALILDDAPRKGYPVRVGTVRLADVEKAQGMFLTNAVAGVWPVRRFLEKNFAINLLPVCLLEAVQGQVHKPEAL